MLRPEAVRLGRENKDLCVRLRDDIEKAFIENTIAVSVPSWITRWTISIAGWSRFSPTAMRTLFGEYPYAIHAQHR